jgi:hypothetical protein
MYVPVHSPAGGAPGQPALAAEGADKLAPSIGPLVAVLSALWQGGRSTLLLFSAQLQYSHL